ncbi:MAG: alcohol dehydrogenase catalytic domain-containing protein [Clostridiales bacterium]|nr:alcohol dehydrogenase catalytic domain-containing protein [Candidatus Crickella caballi]
MKAIYYNGSYPEYRENHPVPERKSGESLLKVRLAAVCTTDKEVLKGYRPDFNGVMGHEFTAVVVESDNSELVGKRVVGEINEVCHECLYCRTGREHHCINRRTPGLSRDGCFAEYMVLRDENLHAIPDELPDEMAIYTEPLAAAYEIVEQIEFETGTPACVIGDGRLALCVAQVLHQYGAEVTVIGKHPEKLRIFESFAKTEQLDSTTMKIEDPAGTGAEIEPYELVVEATGSASGLELALQLVRSMGTIVLKSTYAGGADVNLSLIPVREITVIGSRCGPFDKALDGLTGGAINLPEIDLYDLADFEKAFQSRKFKSGFRI